MEQIRPKKPYTEICSKVREMKPITNFDDIKVGEYYHIPPFYYHKRRDIYVLEKKNGTIKCMTLTEGEKKPYVDYHYKTTFIIKFLIKYNNIPARIKNCFLPF